MNKLEIERQHALPDNVLPGIPLGLMGLDTNYPTQAIKRSLRLINRHGREYAHARLTVEHNPLWIQISHDRRFWKGGISKQTLAKLLTSKSSEEISKQMRITKATRLNKRQTLKFLTQIEIDGLKPQRTVTVNDSTFSEEELTQIVHQNQKSKKK